jgi:hypothetical protein
MSVPSSTDWLIGNDGALVLPLADPRLAAFADFLFLVANPSAAQLTVTGAAKPEADGGTASTSGTVDAWESSQTRLEFSWVAETGVATRIALSKPMALFSGIDLSFLPITDLQQHVVAEALSPDGAGFAVVTGSYSGKVTLGASEMLVTLTGYGAPAYQLAIDFGTPDQGGSPPGLGDIAALLGLMNDPHADLQWLPQDLQTDLISLTALSARIEPADPKKLTQISVSLSFLSGKTWPAIPGVSWLEVRDLSATLEVDYPLESDFRFPRLTVRGTVQFDGVTATDGNAHIDLTVRWPDLQVSGELRREEQITLIKLLTHLGMPADGLPTGARELTITQLGFLAEPAMDKKQFSFHAAVENAWSIDLPGPKPVTLSIESLSFELPYHEGETPTMLPSFSGVIGLGGLDIALSAKSEANGWSFSGSTGPGQPIKIGEWIAKLADTFGSVAVPDFVAGVALENLDVTFNTATKDFHFSIEAKLPLSITTPPIAGEAEGASCDLTLTLDFLNHEDVYENKFAGRIVLGDRKFDLNFAETGAKPAAENTAPAAGTTLVASYQNTEGDTITLKELLTAVGVDGQNAPDLSITLKTALFALQKPPSSPETWKVFGVNIDGGLNL